MAVAIKGCASWSSSARPAPRNIAASLSICHIIELGPNTPSQLSAEALRMIANSRSRSSSPTTQEGPNEVPIASPAIRNSSRPLMRHQNRHLGAAEHVQGKTAEDPFTQSAPAVAAHYEQCRVRGGGRQQDLRSAPIGRGLEMMNRSRNAVPTQTSHQAICLFFEWALILADGQDHDPFGNLQEW